MRISENFNPNNLDIMDYARNLPTNAKRIFYVLVLAALTACGGGEADNTNSSTAMTREPTKVEPEARPAPSAPLPRRNEILIVSSKPAPTSVDIPTPTVINADYVPTPDREWDGTPMVAPDLTQTPIITPTQTTSPTAQTPVLVPTGGSSQTNQ